MTHTGVRRRDRAGVAGGWFVAVPATGQQELPRNLRHADRQLRVNPGWIQLGGEGRKGPGTAGGRTIPAHGADHLGSALFAPRPVIPRSSWRWSRRSVAGRTRRGRRVVAALVGGCAGRRAVLDRVRAAAPANGVFTSTPLCEMATTTPGLGFGMPPRTGRDLEDAPTAWSLRDSS